MVHICVICNKQYSSYQSLWIHNKKYHNSKISIYQHTISNISANNQHSFNNNIINKLSCKYCKKIFKHTQSRWRHEQSCENKNKIDEIQEKFIMLENKIDQLSKINKNQKSTTKIINKISGNLINGHNQNINNKQFIYKTGTEDLNTISYNEVSTIFDNEISSVIKLIELINFNEAKPENHSFCSTALESSYLSFYNAETNTINKERKKYFFEEVICKSIQNHEILYDKFKSKFNLIKRKQIEDNIYNLKKIRDSSFNNKIMGELVRNLNLLSYNKRNLIQDTWNNEYDNSSDEEFMKMILTDPNETKYQEKLEDTVDNINPTKKKQLIDSICNLLSEIKNTQLN